MEENGAGVSPPKKEREMGEREIEFEKGERVKRVSKERERKGVQRIERKTFSPLPSFVLW